MNANSPNNAKTTSVYPINKGGGGGTSTEQQRATSTYAQTTVNPLTLPCSKCLYSHVLYRLSLSRYIQNLLNQVFTEVSDALTEVFGMFGQAAIKNMQFYGFSHGCCVWDNQNFGPASAMDNW